MISIIQKVKQLIKLDAVSFEDIAGRSLPSATGFENLALTVCCCISSLVDVSLSESTMTMRPDPRRF